MVYRSSDFENKFVCGEIMTYEDLKEYGSETAVKAAGKLRQQGKPYESKFFSKFLFFFGC
jgi:ribosome-binding ATPase YchF (GTP1/OBG family)